MYQQQYFNNNTSNRMIPATNFNSANCSKNTMGQLTPTNFNTFQKKCPLYDASPRIPKYSPRRVNLQQNLTLTSGLQSQSRISLIGGHSSIITNTGGSSTNANSVHNLHSSQGMIPMNNTNTQQMKSNYTSSHATSSEKTNPNSFLQNDIKSNQSPYHAHHYNERNAQTIGNAMNTLNTVNNSIASVSVSARRKNTNQFEFIDIENIPQTQAMNLIDRYILDSSGEKKTYLGNRGDFHLQSNGKSNNNLNLGTQTSGNEAFHMIKQVELFKHSSPMTPSSSSCSKQQSNYIPIQTLGLHNHPQAQGIVQRNPLRPISNQATHLNQSSSGYPTLLQSNDPYNGTKMNNKNKMFSRGGGETPSLNFITQQRTSSSQKPNLCIYTPQNAKTNNNTLFGRQQPNNSFGKVLNHGISNTPSQKNLVLLKEGELGTTPIRMQRSSRKVSIFNLENSRDHSPNTMSNILGRYSANNFSNQGISQNASHNMVNQNIFEKDTSNIFNFMNDKDQSHFSQNLSREVSTFQTPLKGVKLNYAIDATNFDQSSYRANPLPNSIEWSQKNKLGVQYQQRKGIDDSPCFQNELKQKNSDSFNNTPHKQAACTEDFVSQPEGNILESSAQLSTFQQMIRGMKIHYTEKQNQLQQIKQVLEFSNHYPSNDKNMDMKPNNQNVNTLLPKNNDNLLDESEKIQRLSAAKNGSIIPQGNQNGQNQQIQLSSSSSKKNGSTSSTSYTSMKKKAVYEEALQQADQGVKNVFKKFDILLKNKFDNIHNNLKTSVVCGDNSQIGIANPVLLSPSVIPATPLPPRNNSQNSNAPRSPNQTTLEPQVQKTPRPSITNLNTNGVTGGYIPSSLSANLMLLKAKDRTHSNNQSDKPQLQQPKSSGKPGEKEKPEPAPIEPSKALEKFSFGKILVYHPLYTIGFGSYAVVRVVQETTTKDKYALKTYEKKKLQDPQKRKNVAREVKILSKIKHANIIRLYDVIETTSQLHLLMEFPTSTPLNAHIKSKSANKLPEEEAKIIFGQLVEAIKYCHRKSVVHRDIKLENVLYDASTQRVKLIDFGFAIALAPGSKLNVFCGTPSYMAPEIVNKKEYTFPVDTWALGILLFKALNGNFPFRGQDDKELYKRINSCKLDFQPNISIQAKNLLGKILKNNPNERYTAEQILQDEWFKTKTPAEDC